MTYTNITTLVLALCILMALAACGTQDAPPTTTPVPTPPSSDARPATPTSAPVVVVEDEAHGMEIDRSYYGAAVASLEQRVHDADVVVRAALLSTGDGTLTFRAVEYLKGTGSQEFTINADTAGRSTAWDNREAVLFLNTSSGESAGGSSGTRDTTASVFEFPDTADTPFSVGQWGDETGTYAGDLPQGYTVDSRNPVWIPATTAGSSIGSSTTRSHIPNHNPDFITEAGSGPPTASLQDIRDIIAWLEGGTSDLYRECIRLALAHERDARDNLAHLKTLSYYRFGEPGYSDGEPGYLETSQISSGSATGTNLYYGSWDTSPSYLIGWIQGQNKDLFLSGNDDTDTDPTNGFSPYVRTARPLPGGTYTFEYYAQSYLAQQCNYVSPYYVFRWTVDVVSPELTVLEALFDPQTTGSGDGYVSSGDLTTGDLSNTDFNVIVGNVDVSIDSLQHESSAVTLDLSPYNALAGYTLDFITGDGTTSLTLTGDAATGDSTAKTLTWAVSGQPWSSGDELMLRITAPWTGVRVALSPREHEILPLTHTDITISWADPHTCTAQYFVGLYEGETVVRAWGHHPATTTSITRSTQLAWDSIPNNTSTARVVCADNDWRTVGDVPLTSGLP